VASPHGERETGVLRFMAARPLLRGNEVAASCLRSKRFIEENSFFVLEMKHAMRRMKNEAGLCPMKRGFATRRKRDWRA